MARVSPSRMLKAVLDLAKKRIDELERTCAAYQTRLRDELRPLGGIVAHMAHPSWAAAPDLSETYYANAAYAQYFGSSDAHSDGEPGLVLVHPEDRHLVIRGRRVSAGSPEREYEFRVSSESGETRWLRERVSVVLDKDGGATCRIGVAVDITAYKHLEERVSLVRQALAVVRPAMFATDLDGRIRYWSSGAERLFGWAASEAESQRARDVLELLEQRGHQVEPDSPRTRAHVGPAELHVRRADGTSCWVSLSGAPLIDAARAQAGMLYVATDLSVLRQLEDRVVRQQGELAERPVASLRTDGPAAHASERLHAVTDALQLGFWELDTGTGAVQWDARMHDITGVGAERFDGTRTGFLDTVAPDQRAEMDGALAAFAAGEARGPLLCRLATQGVRWMRLTRLGMVSEHRLSGIAQDVTADVMATQMATRGVDRTRPLFDHLPEAAALLDGSGRFVRTNRAFQRLVGRTASDLRGRLPREAGVDPDCGDELTESLARAEFSGREQPFRCGFLSATGECIPVEGRVTAVRVDGARHHLLTARRSAHATSASPAEPDEALLHAVNRELAGLDLDRHVVAADLRHFVRTAVSEILGTTEALELGVYGPMAAKQAERLHDVSQAGGRLLGAMEARFEWLWSAATECGEESTAGRNDSGAPQGRPAGNAPPMAPPVGD